MTQVLAHYQQEACLWLLKHSRGILADAPGVGKTLPVIEAAKLFDPPRLIVTPAYLTINWKSYLEEQGETSIAIVQGGVAEKKSLLASHFDWTIISYDTLAREDYEALAESISWGIVIADECHRLRGRNSNRTNMAYRLFRKIPRFWGATGTPMVSNAGDVYPLLRLCDPGVFTSYWRFVEEYAKVRITPWGKKIGGPRNQEEFNQLLRPYMFRRTLEEVLPDVPDFVEEIIRVEVSEKCRARIEKAKTQYLRVSPDGLQTRIGAGGLVSELRHIVNEDDSKTEAMLGLLEDIPEEEQVVIFTWHRAYARDIHERLEGKALIATGDLSPTDRIQVVNAFKAGKARVLIATIAALSEGIDLQSARFVIFMEQDWVEATNDQALARLRRRGQERTVIKYVVIAKKTVDEKVYRAAQKRATINDIFDSLWTEE